MENFQIKQDNESFLDYAERLIDGKENKLYDIDKSEIYNLLFLEEVGSDHARKVLGGIKKFISTIKKEGIQNISEDEIVKKIEDERRKLEKEKIKLRSLRLDINRVDREDSRSELLLEEFTEEIKRQNKLPYPEFKELKSQSSKKEYLLGFADIHFGKEFESITNSYGLEEVYDRFNRLLNETIEIIEENNINHLNVLCLGDLIEGMALRISQLTSLKIGMVQQTIEFMRFMVSFLNKLSEYANITYYQTPEANHSQIRPFGTKANQFPKEDMEKIIFAYIKDMLSDNKRINIIECDEKHVIFKIFDYNIIASHGHDIKNLNKFISDASSKHRIFFDYAFLAHRHHGEIKTVAEGKTNDCQIIQIPSIMGSDEYADDLLVGSKAGAMLIEFTEKQGKRKTYDIILN